MRCGEVWRGEAWRGVARCDETCRAEAAAAAAERRETDWSEASVSLSLSLARSRLRRAPAGMNVHSMECQPTWQAKVRRGIAFSAKS